MSLIELSPSLQERFCGTMWHMVIIDPSRNRARRAGEPFKDMVDLPGWENQSIWGYDLGTQTYFAQLWRNTTDKGDPDIWLSGISPLLQRPESVALALVQCLHIDAVTAVRALALAASTPQVRSPSESMGAIVKHGLVHSTEITGKAMNYALNWTAGVPTEKFPGSLLPWRGGQPTAAEVDAEHCLVTARIYQGQEQEAWSGVDLALWWALKRTDELGGI